MCSLSLSLPIEAPEATRGVKALLFFLSISATAAARAARRSSVLSSFLQSLHLQSGAHRPPAAKQTQYPLQAARTVASAAGRLPLLLLLRLRAAARRPPPRREQVRVEQVGHPDPVAVLVHAERVEHALHVVLPVVRPLAVLLLLLIIHLVLQLALARLVIGQVGAREAHRQRRRPHRLVGARQGLRGLQRVSQVALELAGRVVRGRPRRVEPAGEERLREHLWVRRRRRARDRQPRRLLEQMGELEERRDIVGRRLPLRGRAERGVSQLGAPRGWVGGG